MRVVAALVDVTSGAPLWSETYNGPDIEDILDVQGELSQQVAEALGARLTPNERARVRSSQPVDFETYQLYLRGRFLLSQRTPASVDSAITMFTAATERRGPSGGFAALANSYNVKWGLGLGSKELTAMRQTARAAAHQAIGLDGTSAEAHLALAFLNWTTLDWDGAGAAFERALSLNPGETTAHHWYAMYLSCIGRLEEAIRHVESAQQLDPVNVRTHTRSAGSTTRRGSTAAPKRN